MLKADNVFFVLLRRPRQPITADELESQSRTSRLGGGKHLDGAAEITWRTLPMSSLTMQVMHGWSFQYELHSVQIHTSLKRQQGVGDRRRKTCDSSQLLRSRKPIWLTSTPYAYFQSYEWARNCKTFIKIENFMIIELERNTIVAQRPREHTDTLFMSWYQRGEVVIIYHILLGLLSKHDDLCHLNQVPSNCFHFCSD